MTVFGDVRYCPPSARRNDPVMNDAAGLAKKRHALLTSVTCPNL